MPWSRNKKLPGAPGSIVKQMFAAEMLSVSGMVGDDGDGTLEHVLSPVNHRARCQGPYSMDQMSPWMSWTKPNVLQGLTYPDKYARFIASIVLYRNIIPVGQSPSLLHNTVGFMSAFLTFIIFFSIIILAHKIATCHCVLLIVEAGELLKHRLSLHMKAISYRLSSRGKQQMQTSK